MGRRQDAHKRRRSVAVAVAVLLLAAAVAAGIWIWGRSKGSSPPPASPAPALVQAVPEPEPTRDPRQMAFPPNLTPEQLQKLTFAIDFHLQALDAQVDGDAKKLLQFSSQALRNYSEAGAIIADLGQLQHLLVVALVQTGRDRDAARAAQEWLKRFPDSYAQLETLGKIEFKRGAFKEAAEALSRARALRPPSVVLERMLAVVYSSLGSKEAGKDAAAASLRLIGFPSPGFWAHKEAEATLRTALSAYHRFYDHENALPVALALLERFPGDSMASVTAGIGLAQLGRYAEAEKHLTRVVDDPERGDEVRFELGVSIFKQGQPKRALEVFGSLLERSPHYSRAYFQVGQCLVRLGRPDVAQPFFAMAKTLAPSEREMVREVEQRGLGKAAEAAKARAKALSLRRQFAEAEKTLRAPELKGNPAAAVYLLEFLVEHHRAHDAEEALRDAAQILGENHPDVQGWRALALAQKGRAREAVALLGPLAQLNIPSNPWPRAIGLVFLDELDDPRSAIPWLERALSRPPNTAELVHLARALLAASEAPAALKLLELISRGDLEWEDKVRILLGLALLRTDPTRGDEARGLIEGAPEAVRSGRAGLEAQLELLTRNPDPQSRNADEGAQKRLARYREMEQKVREVRSQAAAVPWQDGAGALVQASRLRVEMGDRPGGLRLAYLAADAAGAGSAGGAGGSAGRNSAAEASRWLAELLSDPAEVFFRLAAVRRWRTAAPSDATLSAVEAETRKAASFTHVAGE